MRIARSDLVRPQTGYAAGSVDQDHLEGRQANVSAVPRIDGHVMDDRRRGDQSAHRPGSPSTATTRRDEVRVRGCDPAVDPDRFKGRLHAGELRKPRGPEIRIVCEEDPKLQLRERDDRNGRSSRLHRDVADRAYED